MSIAPVVVTSLALGIIIGASGTLYVLYQRRGFLFKTLMKIVARAGMKKLMKAPRETLLLSDDEIRDRDQNSVQGRIALEQRLR